MTMRFGQVMAAIALVALVLAALVALPAKAQGCGPRGDRPFRVFNALAHNGQPDMRAEGLEPIHIIDRGIWAPGISRRAAPDPALVQQYVDGLPDDGAPIVLDFEDFNLTQSEKEASTGVTALTRIVQAFRKAAPARQLGFYGYIPNRDYWRAIEPSYSSEYRSWQKENDRARLLERHVDVLFPSLYTFYTDEEGWEKYAEAQICEARRLSSKPVYIFLWPEYHGTEKGGGASPIPGPYWRRQLEIAHRYADGVVIWGGWDFKDKKIATWDPKAGWWLETRRFMRNIK